MRLLGETLGVEIQVCVFFTSPSSSLLPCARNISMLIPRLSPVSAPSRTSPTWSPLLSASPRRPPLSPLPPRPRQPLPPSPLFPRWQYPPPAAPAAPTSRETAQDRIISFEPPRPSPSVLVPPFDATNTFARLRTPASRDPGDARLRLRLWGARPRPSGDDLPFRRPPRSEVLLGHQGDAPSVYTSMADAVKKCPDRIVVVNFASSRSVYASTLECLEFPSIKAIALIAEGVPERNARENPLGREEEGRHDHWTCDRRWAFKPGASGSETPEGEAFSLLCSLLMGGVMGKAHRRIE